MLSFVGPLCHSVRNWETFSCVESFKVTEYTNIPSGTQGCFSSSIQCIFLALQTANDAVRHAVRLVFGMRVVQQIRICTRKRYPPPGPWWDEPTLWDYRSSRRVLCCCGLVGLSSAVNKLLRRAKSLAEQQAVQALRVCDGWCCRVKPHTHTTPGDTMGNNLSIPCRGNWIAPKPPAHDW